MKDGVFLAMEDERTAPVAASQRTHLVKSTAETSAERSRRLATSLRKKKQRGSPP